MSLVAAELLGLEDTAVLVQYHIHSMSHTVRSKRRLLVFVFFVSLLKVTVMYCTYICTYISHAPVHRTEKPYAARQV